MSDDVYAPRCDVAAAIRVAQADLDALEVLGYRDGDEELMAEAWSDEAARMAEQMEVIPAPDGSGERHIVLAGALVGKMLYDEAELGWEAYALIDGELAHAVGHFGEREDVEEADREAIGYVAALIAGMQDAS